MMETISIKHIFLLSFDFLGRAPARVLHGTSHHCLQHNRYLVITNSTIVVNHNYYGSQLLCTAKILC